jgi:hypothetical protein
VQVGKEIKFSSLLKLYDNEDEEEREDYKQKVKENFKRYPLERKTYNTTPSNENSKSYQTLIKKEKEGLICHWHDCLKRQGTCSTKC